MIGLQLERIIRGFFKVNVLAMLLHTMQENGLEQLTQPVAIEHKLFAAIQLTDNGRIPTIPLRKFLRLYRHYDRLGAPDADSAARKLQSPILSIFIPGFLEPVAYHALDVAQDLGL